MDEWFRKCARLLSMLFEDRAEDASLRLRTMTNELDDSVVNSENYQLGYDSGHEAGRRESYNLARQLINTFLVKEGEPLP